jgi:Fe-S-cluster containining protein
MDSLCELCRGICCECLITPWRLIKNWNWWELHAVGKVHEGFVVAVRCRNLTTEGRCSDYENRPVNCREFEPGSPDCLELIRLRRPEIVEKVEALLEART